MEPVRPTEPPEASPPDAPLPDLPSSEALRELRARAGSLLHGQRDLSLKLEQRLEACLDELAQNMADQTAQDETHGLASIDAARQAFEAERSAWQAEREADEQRLKEQSDQLAAQSDQLAQEADERQRSAALLKEQADKLAADQAECDARAAGLERAVEQAAEQARKKRSRKPSPTETKEPTSGSNPSPISIRLIGKRSRRSPPSWLRQAMR